MINYTAYADRVKKSVCAGYLIGLAAEIYARCKDVRIGAVLFGLGLLTICAFKLKLFTGMIGEGRLIECIDILLYNAVGVAIAISVLRIFPEALALGVACGSLMQIGVCLYAKHPWATMLCVAAFLLSGFRHCVALIYYAYQYEFLNWVFIFFSAVIGNIIGAKLVAFGGVKKEENN